MKSATVPLPRTNVQFDRVLPLTRITAAVVIPFLVLAFIILYLRPEESGERFAWEINPLMMAMYIGSGYIGGAYFFLNVLLGRAWHRVHAGFLPVAAFATSMLLITILHWERFDINHFPFQLWLVLYIITPFLIPYIWLRNRKQDPLGLSPGDKEVLPIMQFFMGLLGLVFVMLTVFGFLFPEQLVSIWVWTLTSMSARILSGWFLLLGIGGLAISREKRWSAWQVPLTSIALWQALILVAAWLRAEDFNQGTWLNWYTLSVIVILGGILGIFGYMLSRPATFT